MQLFRSLAPLVQNSVHAVSAPITFLIPIAIRTQPLEIPLFDEFPFLFQVFFVSGIGQNIQEKEGEIIILECQEQALSFTMDVIMSD